MDCYDQNDFHVELVDNIRLIVDAAKQENKIASIGEFGVQDNQRSHGCCLDIESRSI